MPDTQNEDFGTGSSRRPEKDWFEIEVEVTTTETIRKRHPPSRKHELKKRLRENIERNRDDVVDVTIREVRQR